MAMQRLSVLAAIPLLFGATQATAADATTAPANLTPHVLPVLVAVNSHGKVIKASPATALQPAVAHVLRQTLDRAVTQAAHDAAGKPIASSFVMKFSVRTTPVAHDNYKVELAYLSTKALPSGSWAWCRARSGGQTQLVNLSVPGTVCPTSPPSYLWGSNDSLILKPGGMNARVPSPGRAQRQ